MSVTVEFYGILQEQCATTSAEIEADTVQQLFAGLSEQYPMAAGTFQRTVAAINDDIVPRSQPLLAGQTVALLPPVGGG